MKISKLKVMIMTMAVMASLFSNNSVMAAEVEKAVVNEETQENADSDKKQKKKLKESKTQKEIQDVNSRIEKLNQKILDQEELQERIMELLEKMENANRMTVNSNNGSALVNPNQGQKFSYTQDAANSQDNSTVIFKYAPNQLYKIYCRVGYLTDLAMKKGETITFVGGGDTSAWALEKATVDGVAHIYIKPTVETSTTNLIITTNKRSYQLILNTSDWYNPMVAWNYGYEDQSENNFLEEKNEVGNINGNVETLNFKYKIVGKCDRKLMVFDDGEKTIVKFEKMPKNLPSVFVRNKGKKGLNLVNYKFRNNCCILDRVADEIEIMVTDKEIIKIKSQK